MARNERSNVRDNKERKGGGRQENRNIWQGMEIEYKKQQKKQRRQKARKQRHMTSNKSSNIRGN